MADLTTSADVDALMAAANNAAIRNAIGLGAVENTALTTWAGATTIVTVGTVTTGIWHGTAIADTYVASAATWNAKQDALSLGTGVGTFLTTPSGANLATALTSALPATKGGTGLTSLGTGVSTAIGNATGGTGGLVTFSGAHGAATSTTMAIGGATLGTNALAVTGTTTFTSGIYQSGGSIFCNTGGIIGWGSSPTQVSRVGMQATGNGLLRLDNNGAGTGITLDFATADTIKVRNYGNSADGTFTAGVATFSARINLASYTVATLPAAGVAGGQVYCSDAGGNGPCAVVSNATNWKRSDNAATTVS
jgi:hypothetical protein